MNWDGREEVVDKFHIFLVTKPHFQEIFL